MSLSAAARQAMMAQETTAVFIERVKITHPSLPDALRVVNTRTEGDAPITSQGEDYLPAAFSLRWPQQDGDSVPSGRLMAANVDRRILAALRPLIMPRPVVEIAVILSTTPDVVEYGPIRLSLMSVTFDALVLEGAIAAANRSRKRFPAARRTPADSPGLF